jgi:hypothetical protein
MDKAPYICTNKNKATMPFIDKEEVKAKRQAIRKALPGYKISVTRRDYSELFIRIKEGPEALAKETGAFNPRLIDQYEGEAYRALKIIADIAEDSQEEQVFDQDYGSVPNYYVNIVIDRDYRIKERLNRWK